VPANIQRRVPRVSKKLAIQLSLMPDQFGRGPRVERRYTDSPVFTYNITHNSSLHIRAIRKLST